MNNEHYYSSRPLSGHNKKKITETLRGLELSFMTDMGIFSRNCIDAGTKLIIENVSLDGVESILDLGCGYGPIGITLAKLAPESMVYMIDTNERAVDLTMYNIKLNNVPNASVYPGDGYQPVSGKRFDLIVTNPPIRAGKKIIYGFIEKSVQHLNSGGRFSAVIQTKQGAKTFKKKMENTFPEVSIIARGGGYKVFEGIM